MFNLNFTELNPISIADQIKKNGYFIIENALTTEYIDQLLKEIDFERTLVNSNDVGVVLSGNQKFLTYCLAKSKKVYDIVTYDKVLDICQEYFPDKYKLVNNRICYTAINMHMPWHTDNNIQSDDKLIGKHDFLGLQFIFYLTSVKESPFQYIKDSHIWSSEYDEIYLGDDFVNSNYKESIITFEMNKGGLIICNTHGFHRAKPFQNLNHSRTILSFQVDEVNSKNVGHGERNLINPEYVDKPTKKILDYLGFGARADYPSFPVTSLANMHLEDIFRLQRQLFPLTLRALLKTVAKAILPDKFIIDLKRIAWRSRDISS